MLTKNLTQQTKTIEQKIKTSWVGLEFQKDWKFNNNFEKANLGFGQKDNFFSELKILWSVIVSNISQE